MNNSFTTDVSNRVQKLTGLIGDPQIFVSGAAVVTAMLGKFPTKVDLYTYAGMSEHEMDIMMDRAKNFAWTNGGALKTWFRAIGIYDEPKAKAMIYTIAADLILEGLVENSGDVDGRARGLLKTLVHPQQIQTRKQFDGFLVTLEYLRHRSRGLDSSLSAFIRCRYGRLHKSEGLRQFCNLIVENSPESFPDDNYSVVIDDLVNLLKICE